MVFIKDCVGRLCDRLRSEYREQPVQNISRVMSECLATPHPLLRRTLIAHTHCMV